MYQPHGIYRYTGGVNWRAWVAFILGVVPTLPGFANALTPSINVGNIAHIYQFGWLFGFATTGVFYVGLSYAFPPRDTLIERAVLPDEIYDSYGVGGEIEGVPLDKLDGCGEKANGGERGFRSWAHRMIRASRTD